MIAFGVFLVVLAVLAAIIGGLLLLVGLANVQMLICSLLLFLISAVLITGGMIFGAIMDLEKAVKEKGKKL
jgi:hypothetical protein